MNGAESLLRTLVSSGVNICFTNPGTSEMYCVAALDQVQEMRAVLGLFEGVVSGAADGYARMLDKPAATLLHLGPGLANALANFHNARKARVPIINIVGEHATYHRECDPPLGSDISAFAAPVSGWIRTVESPQEIPAATREAVIASLHPHGRIATLIVPADCSWENAPDPDISPIIFPQSARAGDDAVEGSAQALLAGGQAALLMTGAALRERGLEQAGKIAAHTGARLFCDTFNARIERGAGRTPIFSLPYFPEKAIETLTGLDHLILVGTKAPVGFFAYPGVPNRFTPEGVKLHVLSTPDQDALDALERLVSAVGAEAAQPRVQELQQPAPASGEFGPQTIAQSIAALMPEHAIVVDEAVSSGLSLPALTLGAPPHDWLAGTGGAIGLGAPLAAGAAVACPDRRVLCLEADGSGMYTLQALWTQARESLNVTTVIFSNRAYRILQMEHHRLGIGPPGPGAYNVMSLDRPALYWVKLAEGMGVPAEQVDTIEAFNHCLQNFLNEPGPNLIEAVF
jgi:acetolactate synthase-1/2/3 large subunit